MKYVHVSSISMYSQMVPLSYMTKIKRAHKSSSYTQP